MPSPPDLFKCQETLKTKQYRLIRNLFFYAPQKGVDPSPRSRRDTLLRLHPNHRSHLRQLPPLMVRPPASGVINSHGVTGGVYKARERIHRNMADLRLLAIPASCSRVADCNPDYDRVFEVRSISLFRFSLSLPLQHVCRPGHKGHDDLTSSPSSSGLSPAVSLESPPEVLVTNDKGCARCGT